MSRKKNTQAVRRDFDKDFFDRYYRERSTAVVSTDEIDRLVRFVVSYLDHLRVPVNSVLDAGCGMGYWQNSLMRMGRRVDYTGIDVSEYLCRRYGWRRTTIAEFKSRSKFDLVVCQDVLQYVDDDEVRKSIVNMGRLCRGALYFDVPTKEDITDGALDLTRTDKKIYVRGAGWYKRLLERHFFSAGGGVFIPRESETVVLALERG